jgi:hypothetical protein
MQLLRRLRLRFRSLFRRAVVDEELDRELRMHIDQLTRELMTDGGLSADEARRAARLQFGPVNATREQCRDVRQVTLLEDFIKDGTPRACSSARQASHWRPCSHSRSASAPTRPSSAS